MADAVVYVLVYGVTPLAMLCGIAASFRQRHRNIVRQNLEAELIRAQIASLKSQ